MKFCQKCGSILVPKKSSGKYLYECSCGYSSDVDENDRLKESVDNSKEIEVVDDESGETNPLVEIDCPKCNNNQAYFWLEQTRSGDESETKFYKCQKCKHIWRDYS